MSLRFQRFLLGSGWLLLFAASIRLYRVIRAHEGNEHFAPQLLVATLSVWIATSILKVGMRKKVMNKNSAIRLIRSGSVLLTIWGYRLTLILRETSEGDLPLQAYLAPFYIVIGTAIMCAGLKVSRGLRKESRSAASLPDDSSPSSSLSEKPLEE